MKSYLLEDYAEGAVTKQEALSQDVALLEEKLARWNKRTVETPMGKLTRQILEEVHCARVALLAGKPQSALVSLEYINVIVDDIFHEHPEIKKQFYQQSN